MQQDGASDSQTKLSSHAQTHVFGRGVFDANPSRRQSRAGCLDGQSKLGNQLFDPRRESSFNDPRGRRFTNTLITGVDHEPDTAELCAFVGIAIPKGQSAGDWGFGCEWYGWSWGRRALVAIETTFDSDLVYMPMHESIRRSFARSAGLVHQEGQLAKLDEHLIHWKPVRPGRQDGRLDHCVFGAIKS